MMTQKKIRLKRNLKEVISPGIKVYPTNFSPFYKWIDKKFNAEYIKENLLQRKLEKNVMEYLRTNEKWEPWYDLHINKNL